MQDTNVICSDLLTALNTTVICVYGKEHSTEAATVRNATLSDTDPSGAVKFTIAVVLLYGVGVIGLLGITARRNRRVEMMDKEVNKFLKMQHQSYSFKRRTKRRKMKAVGKLISALHFQDKFEDSDFVSSKKRLENCKSWTVGMDSTKDGTEKISSLTVINETAPYDDSSDNSNYNSVNGPLLSRDSDVPARFEVSLLHQDSLRRIEEGNGDGYLSERRISGDSDFVEDVPV